MESVEEHNVEVSQGSIEVLLSSYCGNQIGGVGGDMVEVTNVNKENIRM